MCTPRSTPLPIAVCTSLTLACAAASGSSAESFGGHRHDRARGSAAFERRAASHHPSGAAPDGAPSQCLTSPAAGSAYVRAVARSGGGVERWPDRIESPIRVWISAPEPVGGWRPVFSATVRAAFEEWEHVGIPIRFAFITDSTAAEIRVYWVGRLSGGRAGVAHWWTDRDGRRRRGDFYLATIADGGIRHRRAHIRAIALHEIGHVIGLRHSPDPTDIMVPLVRARELSACDRATARRLYSPGAQARSATLADAVPGWETVR